MKRTLIAAIVITVACFARVVPVACAAEQTILITAMVSGIQGVSLSGASWAIGNVVTGTSSASSSITATNTGSGPEVLNMSAVSTGDFTLGSAAGVNTMAVLGKCASTDPNLSPTNALTGTAGQASDNVDPGSDLTVYVMYEAPTSITGGNSDGAVTVTVSTSLAS